MRHSILLALLLSVSSLFANGENGRDAVEQTNAELKKVRTEAAQIKEELAQARAEKEEALASMKVEEEVLKKNKTMHISVVGQGVAPMNTTSPAQAYALAKRAAIADAYRTIAEKVKGVRVDGQDTIKNMMIQKSTIRTYVQAMVRNANLVETNFKDGLCEVEMEVMLSHSDFVQ
jgi:hypothetical protein